MDQILAKASNQAVTFAIRSGITIASTYAIKTVGQFLEKISEHEKQRITNTRNKIQTKINIISLSIDLIKLATARGNSTLESTLDLINELNAELNSFDEHIDSINQNLTGGNEKESIKQVEDYMKSLLNLINDSIPIINLALITSGININGFIDGAQDNISPGRLLQASNHIIKSNEVSSKEFPATVGPVFDLVTYTIFYNPSRAKYISGTDQDTIPEDDDLDIGLSSISWKETFARSEVSIRRTKSTEEKQTYDYRLEIREDFNDGRYHDHEEESPQVKVYNIKMIQRLFFTASGKLLKLDDRSSPVLILKLIDEVKSTEEWVAFGELNVGEFDDDDDEEEDEEVDDDDEEDGENIKKNKKKRAPVQQKANSLSLLEYMLRLTKLQQVEQQSIMKVKDEILSLYLKDELQSSSKPSSRVIESKTISKKLNSSKKSSNRDTSLTLDSNINRLENLKLGKK
ncbi:Ran-specific GTPase-activating protein 30 [Scheffersomyces coipomensis]|uniref:Ran-specific GTPase-activating protein 30 n=1 Tax=Scheffersomyces coipomensis TaxID=1788519 RepID=UPI00315CE471